MLCELHAVPADADFTAADWGRGMNIEMEHTGDPMCASVIAAHHLVEHPRYYDELELMEERLGVGRYEPNPALPIYGMLALASGRMSRLLYK